MDYILGSQIQGLKSNKPKAQNLKTIKPVGVVTHSSLSYEKAEVLAMQSSFKIKLLSLMNL